MTATLPGPALPAASVDAEGPGTSRPNPSLGRLPRLGATDRRSLTVLCALIVCLIGIPSVLIVKPLGAAGTPAGIIGDALLLLIGATRIVSTVKAGRGTPVSRVLLLFVTVLLAAYLAGMTRPITGTELSSADRGLLILGSWCGIVLAVSTGLLTRASLDRFLLVLCFAGAAMATVGVLQFFFGLDVASYIHIPGLTANHAYGGLNVRAGFRRISGTALHAIEFGAVLSLILPITLHYAFYAPKGRLRQWLWVCAAVTGFSIPLTVARSAILGLLIVVVVLFISWTPVQRKRALYVAPFALVAIKAGAPHLIGTLTHLFTNAANDPSVQNRLGDYNAGGYYISRAPLFGRGPFTFLPSMYRTFDNEYEGMLVEGGILGFLALLALILVPALAALDLRRQSTVPATRSLAYALMTSMVVALVTFFTFDAFAFPMCMGVFFILLGAIGCLWRLERDGNTVEALHRADSQAHVERGSVAGLGRRQRAVTGLMTAGLALVVLALGLQHIRSIPPKYEAVGTLKLSSKPFGGQNVYQKNLYLGDIPQLLLHSATGDDTRRELAAAGYSPYEVAVGDGSLQHDTDVLGTGNVMRVSSIAATPQEAAATSKAVMDRIGSTLAQWQRAANAEANLTIVVQTSTGPDLAPVQGSLKRAELFAAMLALIGGLLAYRAAVALARGRSRRSITS